jgi:hypothetical protein
MTENRPAQDPSPISRYKSILLSVIENRPSGTRQRLAEAMGKNRSFISQIVNASYPTPIPAQHLETIFAICHFAPTEREAFLLAYREAHPGKLETARHARPFRRIVVEMPDFGSALLNERADHILHTLARGIDGLVNPGDRPDADDSGGET